MKKHTFKTKLFRNQCKGGWTFAAVPPKHAPLFKLAWGRTPVVASVNNKEWNTSVWTDKAGQVLLPVPKKIRGDKDDGDEVSVTLEYKM